MSKLIYQYEAKQVIDDYITYIDWIKYSISKNDMDLDNTSINTQFDDILNNMLTECNNTINTLESYKFE